MTDISIPRGEIGRTRVFALSMTDTEARRLRDDPQEQMTVLGADALDPSGTEVFALSDLGGMGLAGYLREGADIQEAELARDSAKLAALDGWVLLVHSLAFGGNGATLSPDRRLTLIGTYEQTSVPSAQIELQSEAAKPYTGSPELAPIPTPRRKAGGSVVVALIALVVLGLVWWLLG